MFIIPAIDVYHNKIVRLFKGKFDDITYYPLSPLEQAREFAKHGFRRVHIIDLIGSLQGMMTILEILKAIKKELKIEIEFGGGVRDRKSLDRLFVIGIDKIIIGSLSVKNKSLFESLLQDYDPASFIISVDVNNKMVAVQGWTETTSLSVSDHIEYCCSLGLDQFLCTDISKDGTMLGTNTQMYSDIMTEFPGIKLIASGGIGDMQDIIALKQMNIYGTVVGKAIYEKTIQIGELAAFAK